MATGKLAIFSDLHLDPWTSFANIDERGLNTRLVQVAETLDFILKEAEREKCDAVLFCGDFFHRKSVAIETLHIAAEYLAKTSVPLVMIPGNHDEADKYANFHATKTLKGRAIILDNDNTSINLAGYSIVGIPYLGSVDLVTRIKERLGNTKPDILMLHAPIEDALMGSDFITHEGTGVDEAKLFNMAKLTLVGHYHQPQYFGELDIYGGWEVHIPAQDGDVYKVSTPTVLIPGAPLQHNIGDRDTSRGFWLYDGKSLTFRDSKAPRFVNVTEKELESMDSNEYEIFIKNNYVTIQTDDRVKADQLVKSLKGARGVQSSVSGATKRELKDSRINFKDKSDYKSNIHQYCEAMKTTKDVEELGVRLIEEARKQ